MQQLVGNSGSVTYRCGDLRHKVIELVWGSELNGKLPANSPAINKRSKSKFNSNLLLFEHGLLCLFVWLIIENN